MRSFVLLFAFVVSQVNSCELLKDLAAGAGAAVETVLNPVDDVKKLSLSIENIKKLPDKSLGPQSIFTWLDVAYYDGKDGRSIYIVVFDSVYDVTDIIDLHPGGPDVIKKHAGSDATTVFLLSGMPRVVFDVLLKRCLVGRIVDELVVGFQDK